MSTISVLMVTRNRPQQVRACLRAIADQQGPFQMEVCVVNDGGAPLSALREEFPNLPLRITDWPTHRGQSAARATALTMAVGDFIAWCDDDDRWLPDHLSDLLSAQAEGDALAYTDAELVSLEMQDDMVALVGRTPFAWRDPGQLLRAYNPIAPSSVLYPKRLHAEIGPVDEAVGHYWDWDLWLRIKDVAPIVRVPACLTLYGVWGASANQSAIPEQMRPDLLHLCEKHGLGELPSSNFVRMATDERLQSERGETIILWDGTLDIW